MGDISVLATKAILVKCKPGANSLRVFNNPADKIAFTQSNGPLSHQVLDDYYFVDMTNDLDLYTYLYRADFTARFCFTHIVAFADKMK